MRPTIKKSSGGSFMVGFRRQKLLCLIAAVVSLAVLVVFYLYSFRKTSDAFKPFTALIFASTGTRTHNVAGLQVVKESKRLEYQGYDNSVPFDHVWLSNNCIGSVIQSEGIENIAEFVNAWKKSLGSKCRDLFMKFSSIYLVKSRTAPVVIPKIFAPKVLRWLGGSKELLEGASLQLITSVENLYTQESTVFNPLRAKRPGAGRGATEETKQYVLEILRATAKDCDFCQYKNNTAQDPFGRIESQYSVTVSNTFKVEKFHSLVLWKHHNPLNIKEHELLDAMETAKKWFGQAHIWDEKYTIPQIYWDTLPRASASQIHPHFHVTLAHDQYYAEWNRLYVAAKRYAEDHNGENYFSALTKIHGALGLTVHFGSATVLAYLTPSASHEIMLISKTPCKDLYILLYDCLAAFRDDMGLFAISAATVFPKLIPSPDGSDLPAIIRLVYRGAAESMRADVDSLQLFGTVNVNVDPYMIIRSIKKSVERRKAHVL